MAALTEITEDFAWAVQLASEDPRHQRARLSGNDSQHALVANMDDGTVVRGETKITASKRRIVELTLDPASRPLTRDNGSD